MSDLILDNLILENNLSATTINVSTVNTGILSATTLYGNGSNLTNVNATATPGGENFSVQFNNNNTLSGTSTFLYDGTSLFLTGTTRFSGSFFRTNSPSVKQIHQWGATIAAGTSPGIIWTNMPAGITTWMHSGSGTLTNDATFLTDFTEYTECRLFTSMQVAGAAANTLIAVQYSTSIGGSYSALTSLTIANSTGAKDTGWQTIPTDARGLVYIRLVGQNGNGTVDPRFSPPILLIR